MSDKREHGSSDCRAIFARLSEYLDDELPAELCDELEGHLGDCPPCVAFLESLRRTVRLTETLAGEKLPDDERRRVVEAHARFRRREVDDP